MPRAFGLWNFLLGSVGKLQEGGWEQSLLNLGRVKGI